MNKYTIETVADNLEISTSVLQEIKNRLGIKGYMHEDDYNLICKVVEDVKQHCHKVTTSFICAYWLNYGYKWQNARRTEDE